MTSTRPTFSPEPQGGQSCTAAMEKPALDSLSEDLMEQIVDPASMERAWRKVKANRGAPGPDGITLKQFPKHFRTIWPELRQQLLDGTYRPQAARRKTIEKPDGGERLLGIPNITERLIQQAILQVLQPIFDPDFSESSFGFRPKRSAHGAIKQVQSFIKQGYYFCVNMDLSKFFDRVQHDALMSRIGRKVRDKRVLKLIGRYLRAGIMVNGIVQPSTVASRCDGCSASYGSISVDGWVISVSRQSRESSPNSMRGYAVGCGCVSGNNGAYHAPRFGN